MFVLKQIGDHSLQAKKIWHKKRICYLQKKFLIGVEMVFNQFKAPLFYTLLYIWSCLKIFLFTQKIYSCCKPGIIQRTDFWTKHFLDLLKVGTQTFDF